MPWVVPTGTVVRMQVIGADVIHSFAVPSLGFKIDAIPGRLNEIWFMAEREGLYYGQCSDTMRGSRLPATPTASMDTPYMPIAVRAVAPDKFAALGGRRQDRPPRRYKLLRRERAASGAGYRRRQVRPAAISVGPAR